MSRTFNSRVSALLVALVFLLSGPVLAQERVIGGDIYGGAAAYVPAAMVFNYDTWLGSISAIGAADTKPFTFAWWWLGNWNDNNDTTVKNDWLFQSNPSNIGTVNSTCEATGLNAPGICWSFDSPLHGQFNMNDSLGTSNAHAVRISSTAANPALTPINRYNFQMVTGDPASGHYGVFLNGSDVTASYAPGSTVISNITPSWLTATGGFGIANGRGNGAVKSYTWLSELYLDNVYHGTVGSNGIDLAFVAKLYNSATGLPVDTGADCSKPTGIAPAVCVHYQGGTTAPNTGFAQTSAFTVQTATWNGAGAGTALLSAAPYGPAGIPAHQATTRWITEKRFWAQTAGATSAATTADGATLNTGDLVWIYAQLNASSGTTQFFTGSTGSPGSCPSGFSQVGPMNDTYRLSNSILCYKILVGGDTSGAYTLTFNALANVRNNFYTMGVVSNVASVEAANNNTSWLVVGSRTLTPSTTNVVTTHANDTVISIFGQQSNSNFTTIDAPPSGDALLRETINAGSQAGIYVIEKHGLALGASSTLQMTYHEGANDTFHPYALVLQSN